MKRTVLAAVAVLALVLVLPYSCTAVLDDNCGVGTVPSLACPAVAHAADGPVAVDAGNGGVGTVPSIGLPDPGEDPGAWLKLLVEAFRVRDLRMIGALMIVGVVFAARKWGAKAWPWLATDRGGAVLVLAVSILGVGGTALASGEPILGSLLDGLAAAFLSAGMYQVYRRLVAPKVPG